MIAYLDISITHYPGNYFRIVLRILSVRIVGVSVQGQGGNCGLAKMCLIQDTKKETFTQLSTIFII